MVTCYMGTKNSSHETRERAASLAKETGALHYEVNIDELFTSTLHVFKQISKDKDPKFEVHGGTALTDLALQNIQA